MGVVLSGEVWGNFFMQHGKWIQMALLWWEILKCRSGTSNNKGPEERVPVAEQEERVPRQRKESLCALTGRSTIPKFLFSLSLFFSKSLFFTPFSESSTTFFVNFVIHLKNQIVNAYGGPTHPQGGTNNGIYLTGLMWGLSELIYLKAFHSYWQILSRQLIFTTIIWSFKLSPGVGRQSLYE